MITYEETMKRIMPTLFIALIAAFFFAPILAHAGECGAGGTAKRPDGVWVNKSAAQATEEWVRISPDGFWWKCQSPGGTEPALQMNCMPERPEAFRTWTVGENSCTTYRRNATSPTDQARDRVIREGDTDIWFQWTGAMRGQLLERCVAGKRVVIGATCDPVTHCDVRWSLSTDGGKTVYVYDARPSPVPIGNTVLATASNGKTLKIGCTVNGFSKSR